MPSMGDLVTNLVIDSTRFVSGVDRARDSNTALSGSVNSIIGQLSRQQKAFETAGRSTLDWIEADKKASEETKELVKSLLLQVESLNKVAAARKSMAAQSALFAPLTQPDHFGRGLSRLEAQRGIDTKNSQLAAERDANDPFTQGMAGWQKTNDSFQRGLRQMAVDYGHLQQQITSAATAQERFNAATTHANSARASVTNAQRLADANAATRARKQADYDQLFGAVTESDSERNASDPFLSGMSKWQNEHANNPFARGLRNLANANTNTDPDVNHRLQAARARDQQEVDEAAARDNAERIRQDRMRIRADRDAEDEAERTAEEAVRQRRVDAVRNINGENMDRRQMTGSVGFRAPGISGNERQRFLREQRDLERRMDAESITDPKERSMLTDGLKKSQKEDVSGRLEKERSGILAGLKEKVLAAKQAEDEYTLSKLKSEKASDAVIAKAREQADEHMLKPLRDRGADDNEIAAAKTLINKQRELDDIRTARQTSQHENEKKKDNRKWAGVEGFRAIEDFAQGSAFGGLRGGLLAASNNVSQMGAAFGAAGAMAGSAVSTVIVLGSQIYETWRKSVTGAEAAEAAVKNYDRTIQSVIPHLQEMQDKTFKLRDIRKEKDTDAKSSEREVQQMKDAVAKQELDLRERAKEQELKDRGMGTAGLSAQDLANEAEARRNELLPFLSSLGRAATGQTRRGEHLSDEVLGKDNVEKSREEEREILRRNEVLAKDKAILLEREIQHQKNVERDLNKELANLDDANERRRRHQQGVPLERETEWQKQEMQNQRDADDRRKKMDDTESGYKYLKSRATELATQNADRRQEGGGAMLQAQIEFQDNMDKIKKASRLDLLDPTERATAETAETQKRDRSIREAKYGSLQADGQSGFGSQDARSTGGMNAIMKAIRYAEQKDSIAQLKKIGDIAQEQLIVQQEQRDLAKRDPLATVSF